MQVFIVLCLMHCKRARQPFVKMKMWDLCRPWLFMCITYVRTVDLGTNTSKFCQECTSMNNQNLAIDFVLLSVPWNLKKKLLKRCIILLEVRNSQVMKSNYETKDRNNVTRLVTNSKNCMEILLSSY